MKRTVLKLVLSVVLALCMLRLLYTTTFGAAIVNAVPEQVWQGWRRLSGLSQGQDVETVQNVDAALVSLLCLPLAAAVVWAIDFVVRRSRRA